MLDLFHGEFAHLPQDLGGAQLGDEELWKIKFHIKMVGHTALHFGHPGKDALDGGVRDVLWFGHCDSRHGGAPIAGLYS